MNLRQVLVSHRALDGALVSRGGLESAAPTNELRRAAEAIQTALAKASVHRAGPGAVGALSDALTVLGEADRDPGVMTAVEHPTASLLQSYLAERAAEADSGTPAVAGGFE